jgi:quinolinate synthase
MMLIKEIKMFDSENINKNRLVNEINSLRKEKNAVILAHFYQTPDIQEIADFVGDSLALSQQAAKTKADIIIFAGVYFMAETAKILSPDKKVIIPDPLAGCSLADSCKKEDFEKFIAQYPGATVVTYVNTTAEIKALSDISCTSSNAKQIIESLPKDQKIIFGPDRNLGNYINEITGRNMIVWNGACHVHEKFSVEAILKLKNDNPGSKIIAHPECELPVRIVADFIGSTSDLLKFSKDDAGMSYIVATEPGILYKMKLSRPDKNFIPAPPKDSTCGCSECSFMKMITLEKICNSLKFETPEVLLDPEIIKRAEIPIKRMLEISEKLGL